MIGNEIVTHCTKNSSIKFVKTFMMLCLFPVLCAAHCAPGGVGREQLFDPPADLACTVHQRIYIYKEYKATSPRLHTGDFLP